MISCIHCGQRIENGCCKISAVDFLDFYLYLKLIKIKQQKQQKLEKYYSIIVCMWAKS